MTIIMNLCRKRQPSISSRPLRRNWLSTHSFGYSLTMASSSSSKLPPLSTLAARGVDRVLISSRRLRRRVRELGRQLSQDYAGREVLCVGALNGVLCFLVDLMREMDLPTPIELVHVDRSFTNGDHHVSVPHPFRETLKGRDVLIVEDIVDTGITLTALIEAVRREGPASLRVCALLDKPAHRQADVQIDYIGFTIPPVFVVGYGLDYESLYRNLPFVGVIADAVWPPAEPSTDAGD